MRFNDSQIGQIGIVEKSTNSKAELSRNDHFSRLPSCAIGTCIQIIAGNQDHI